MSEMLIGIAALVALAAWLVRRAGRGRSAPPPERHPGIDLEELEAAEREVRDARPAAAASDDDEHEDDWGPGVPRR